MVKKQKTQKNDSERINPNDDHVADENRTRIPKKH